MPLSKNVSLKTYNTFGIDAKAKLFCNVSSVEDLKGTLKKHQSQPLFILGGGSNMLLTQDIDALVLHINLKGIKIVSDTEDYVEVKAKAGENWHQFVLWCIKNDFGGVENLSLIPGNIGTAPIQNIGAYGVELKDVFVSCEAICIEDQSIKTFTKTDCKFGYRESVFKQELKGKYIITSVTLRLTKNKHNLNLSYGAIKDVLNTSGVKPSIKAVSDAVIAIRQSKLPDPKDIGNSGSFFKNPVITAQHFNHLKANFPKIPSYIISKNEIKIPAGWLIETAGFKGKQFGDYGVHKNQALVLVNYSDAHGADIYKLAQLIQKTIQRIFNISLEIEVNII